MGTENGNENGDGLYAAARALAHRLNLPTTFIKFAVVGGIAFLVNQSALWLFYDSPVFWFLPGKHERASLGLFAHPDIRLLIASVLAVETAILFQFISHERWTFRSRDRDGWALKRFLKFNLSAIVSPVISVATINLLTPVIRDAVGIDTLLGRAAPYLANTAGVALGFTWNWVLNSMIIWPRKRGTVMETEALPAAQPVASPSDGQDRATS
jgi:putative flippase GtrA